MRELGDFVDHKIAYFHRDIPSSIAAVLTGKERVLSEKDIEKGIKKLVQRKQKLYCICCPY